MALVRVVLVRPEVPANVGASARAIANTGLAGLDLVAPCDWRTVEAWRMGWHAEDILEEARVFDTLEDALRTSVYTAGLAAPRRGPVLPITVREMAKEVSALDAAAPAALVFGCESKGLTERELLCCQRRVYIPSHTGQPSLNLAQAVMVACYEVFVAGIGANTPRRERAEAGDIEQALRSLRDAMLEIGFLPSEKPEVRFVEWREIFGRAGLGPREVKLILALARRIRGACRAGRISSRTRNEPADEESPAEEDDS